MKLHNKINGKELKAKLQASSEKRITLSFYRYYYFTNPYIVRDHLYLAWDVLGVLGRIYIAHEGINGQISVPANNMDAFKKSCEELVFMQGNRLNIAVDESGKSFFKLKITVRNKILADGLDDSSFDVRNTGKHLKAHEMNQLLEAENTIVVDMRNHYESEVGHFENAICPDVETFRESLPIIRDMLYEHKEKNIVMYCTGGIRCEKASAYMKHHGYENVFQLEGGIIEYTRQAADAGIENKFLGTNFVFDERLGERIGDEIISHCHQCDTPSDHHVNCANDYCHLLFIQCPDCATKHEGCCSSLCQSYIHRSPEEQKEAGKEKLFNGSKFGKGRYNPTKSQIKLGY